MGHFCPSGSGSSRQNQSGFGSATLLLTTVSLFDVLLSVQGQKTVHSMQRAHKGVLTKRQKESMSPSRPFVLWPSTPFSTAKPTLLFHYTRPLLLYLLFTNQLFPSAFSAIQTLFLSAEFFSLTASLSHSCTQPQLHSARASLSHSLTQPQLHSDTYNSTTYNSVTDSLSYNVAASFSHSFTQPHRTQPLIHSATVSQLHLTTAYPVLIHSFTQPYITQPHLHSATVSQLHSVTASLSHDLPTLSPGIRNLGDSPPALFERISAWSSECT